MSLSWISKGIFHKIKRICCGLLWQGKKDGITFAWVKWDRIALSKKWGGRRMKKLYCFSQAPTVKLGWHLISSKSLWIEVITRKYIDPLSLEDWI